jgi:alkylation response protein AidB-like acyl-CoA dehydrogenase
MRRIVELKERSYVDKDEFDDAPVNYEDAIENYKRILDITGDVAGNIIEPNSESVARKARIWWTAAWCMPRRPRRTSRPTRRRVCGRVDAPSLRRMNLPITVFSMLSELVSAADSGFQNIWSLQSCIDTLYEFGSEEQKEKYIPRISAGETMSMDLTEPDAGSDLQRVMLKATQTRTAPGAERCEAIHHQRRL